MEVVSSSYEPLYVQFGGHTAIICSEDLALHRLIGQYFRHCLGDATLAVVKYHITVETNQHLQLQRDEVSLYSGSSSTYLIERLVQDLITTLTTHCRENLVFHAAGLAYDKVGLILGGQSGSGKSTLATWLTANGFDYLTDELVAVTLDYSKMSGLTRPITLKRGSSFIWQGWLNMPACQDLIYLSNGTVLLAPEHLRPQCIRATVCPCLLLFPRYVNPLSEDRTTTLDVQPLSAAEATFHLMQSLINAKNLPNWGLPFAKGLTQQVIAYRLLYTDVKPVLTWLKQTATALQVQKAN